MRQGAGERAPAASKEAGSSRPRQPRPARSRRSPPAPTNHAPRLGLRTSPSPNQRARPDPAGLASVPRETHPRRRAAQRPGSDFVLRGARRDGVAGVPRETHPRRRAAQRAGSDFVLRRAQSDGLVPIPPASPACLGRRTLGVEQRSERARTSCFAEPEAGGSSRSRRRRRRASGAAPSASSSAATGLGLRASPNPKREARPDPAGLAGVPRETHPRCRPAQRPGWGFVLRGARGDRLAGVPREPHPRRRAAQRAGSGFVLRRTRNERLVPIPPAAPACLGRRTLGVEQRTERARTSCFAEPETRGSSRSRRRRRRASGAAPSASSSAATGLGVRASPNPKREARPDPAGLAGVPRETHPRCRPAQRPGWGFVLRGARGDRLAGVPREPHPRRRAAQRAGSGFVLRRTRNERLVPIPPAAPACLGNRTLGVEQRTERARTSCFAEPETRGSSRSRRPRRRASGDAPSVSSSAATGLGLHASRSPKGRPRRRASGNAPSTSSSAASGLGLRASPNPKREARSDRAGLAGVPRETHPRRRAAHRAGSGFVPRRAQSDGLVPIPPAGPRSARMADPRVDPDPRPRPRGGRRDDLDVGTSPGSTTPARADRANVAQLGENLGLGRYYRSNSTGTWYFTDLQLRGVWQTRPASGSSFVTVARNVDQTQRRNARFVVR